MVSEQLPQSPQATHILKRSDEHPFSELTLSSNSHSFSSFNLKKNLFLRFEGFSFTLSDVRNKANLTTLFFSNDVELPILLEFWEQGIDFTSLICEEIKIFYNAPNDFWLLTTDVKKYKESPGKLKYYRLEEGEKLPRTIPIHLDKYYVEIQLK